jgi:hypothetical protein
VKLVKSPGAVEAARGALEIDQLGGKVDPENSLRALTAQPPSRRAGNATRCLVCGSATSPRRASRRQKYCSYHCRDEARRARNFAASGATRRGSPAIPRSVPNNGVRSIACKAEFGDRTPIEILGHGHRWRGAIRPEIASTIHSIITSELDALGNVTRTGR